MKKSVLPLAFATAFSLAACGSGGSKSAESAITLSPTSSASHTTASKDSTSPSTPKSSTPSTTPTSSTAAVASPTTPPTSVKPAIASPTSAKHAAPSQAPTSHAVAPATHAAPVPAKTSTTAPTPATKVSKVWPDSSWKIETENSDLCGIMSESTASPSPFAAGTFTCGPTAASLLACKKDASGYATCIQDFSRHMAVRFKTKAVISGTAPTTFAPLSVKLQNGTSCSFMSHDQTQHYQNRHGWQYCDNYGVLLLPQGTGDMGDTGNYFDKSGSTWTAQFGMGTNAPTTVKVAQVYYAQ